MERVRTSEIKEYFKSFGKIVPKTIYS